PVMRIFSSLSIAASPIFDAFCAVGHTNKGATTPGSVARSRDRRRARAASAMSAIDHRLFEQPWPEGEYRFFQMGFVITDDVITAASRWARVFGVGPFHVLPVFDQHVMYRGQESTITCQVAVAQAGPVQIELIQQLCDRPSVFREWSRDGTCVFHQVA